MTTEEDPNMLWVGLRQNTRPVIVRNLVPTSANDHGGRAVTRRKKVIKKYSTHFSAYCLSVTKFVCRRMCSIFLCPFRVTTMEGHVTTVEDQVTTIEDLVTTVEDQVTTTEDLVTTVEDIVTTVEVTVSHCLFSPLSPALRIAP